MAKIRVSYEYSEAEDKSIRLGLFLIACGILSLFILGFCWLSPTLQSLQSKPANCTVVSVLRPEEMFECVFTCGADCKGTSLYPCLQIFVNNSESNSVALLHFDEQQLVLNPKGHHRKHRDAQLRGLVWQLQGPGPRTAQQDSYAVSKIVGAPLPFLKEIYQQCCIRRAIFLIKDPHPPSHGLFSLLPSGKRYRNISCRSRRMLNSFFAQAVRLINGLSPPPQFLHTPTLL
ncbi:uncharacterized protein [Channa argus]|uniref:uncharacterized protein isoform X2 n=1 Tax=Channa argus TaxID=215402 RepID=UPI003520F868